MTRDKEEARKCMPVISNICATKRSMQRLKENAPRTPYNLKKIAVLDKIAESEIKELCYFLGQECTCKRLERLFSVYD